MDVLDSIDVFETRFFSGAARREQRKTEQRVADEEDNLEISQQEKKLLRREARASDKRRGPIEDQDEDAEQQKASN
jgi:hypothetical protein